MKMPDVSFYRAMLHRVRLWDCMSSVCLSVMFMHRDHIGWNTSKIISLPNSDKIVMWRFLRNRRLILHLHTIFRALIYWVHRTVIFAIAQFSCLKTVPNWRQNSDWKLSFHGSVFSSSVVWGCFFTSQFHDSSSNMIVSWNTRLPLGLQRDESIHPFNLWTFKILIWSEILAVYLVIIIIHLQSAMRPQCRSFGCS